jgi:hypothetical protein
MEEMKVEKIRFAYDLSQSVVTVEENKNVCVRCLGGNLYIYPHKDEDINLLRNKIFELVKGTPCNAEAVQTLINICL